MANLTAIVLEAERVEVPREATTFDLALRDLRVACVDATLWAAYARAESRTRRLRDALLAHASTKPLPPTSN